jgi:hypothetical protein
MNGEKQTEFILNVHERDRVFFTLGNSKGRRPLVFQDIETNRTITVNIRMIDFGSKVNLYQFIFD